MAQVTSWLFSPMSMKPRPSTTSPLPSAVTAPRRISWPITTSATSPTRIGTPSLAAMTIALICSTFVVRPRPCTSTDRVPSRMLPPPTLRLFSSTACTTSSNVRPCLISRFGIDADLILLFVAAPTVDLGGAFARCASWA